MRQIPDDPIIRFMERTGYAPRHDYDEAVEVCCATCKWYYEDRGICCLVNREPILSADYESCEKWEDADG